LRLKYSFSSPVVPMATGMGDFLVNSQPGPKKWYARASQFSPLPRWAALAAPRLLLFSQQASLVAGPHAVISEEL
jgi:hypothetical protein